MRRHRVSCIARAIDVQVIGMVVEVHRCACSNRYEEKVKQQEIKTKSKHSERLQGKGNGDQALLRIVNCIW